MKEQKNKLNYDRLKKQYEDMMQRNQELQSEIRSLEALRINEQKKGGGSSSVGASSYANMHSKQSVMKSEEEEVEEQEEEEEVEVEEEND